MRATITLLLAVSVSSAALAAPSTRERVTKSSARVTRSSGKPSIERSVVRGRTITEPGCIRVAHCPSTSSCGAVSDGCGGFIQCGTCGWPQLCGAEVANVCGGTQPLNYGAPATFSVDGSPSAIASADLDADGHTDLIASLFSSDGIMILRGDGHGGFTGMPRIDTGRGPRGVAVLDVTGDGLLDVVVAHALDSSIVVLRNAGGAQLVPHQLLTAGVQPTAIVAVDVDGDGRLDVASAMADGHVAVMKTRATGGLAPAQLVDCGTYPTAITASDVDGDGDADLVVANQMGDSVTVLTNNGAGGFSTSLERAAGELPVSVAPLEMSMGARPSLLVANRDLGMLHLLMPDGASRELVLGVSPRALSSADLDGDGLREAAVAHGDGTVMIVKPDTQGTLRTIQTVNAGTAPTMIISDDVNGDGRPDLITANGGSNDVTVHLNAAL